MDSETLCRYAVDAPEEEDPCEGADGVPAADAEQDEGEQIILFVTLFLLDRL